MKKLKLMIAAALAVVALAVSFFVPVFLVNAKEVSAFEISSEISEETTESIAGVETPTESEKNKNSVVEETVESTKGEETFDELLDFTGTIMEKAGYGDEWKKGLYYIKTAATEKKVDVMIILCAIIVVLFAVYCFVKIVHWNKKRKTDTTKKDLEDIKKASGQQTTAINDLIGEDEKIAGNVIDANDREKALAEGIEKQNVAIRCLIRGTQIKQDLKDEAFRALNESDELCDKAKK